MRTFPTHGVIALLLTMRASAGDVHEFTIRSKTYERDRRVWVYTPPGYEPKRSSGYDLVVAFDGADYLRDIPLPAILDSLLAAHQVPPTVAVLIDDSSSAQRLADLANHKRFVTFVADEVIPWVRSKWNVTTDPHHTIITGSSAGGLASAFLALERPDVFGKVLSQSGAFWRGNEGSNDAPYEWLTGQYASTPKRDITFFIDVGSLETRGALGGAAPSILEANRRLHDVLLRKGYSVTYTEVVNGVHSPESWRLRLPVGLAAIASR